MKEIAGVVGDEEDDDVATFDGKMDLVAENWALVRAPKSDKRNRGKAVDLTEEEDFFCSKYGYSGYRNSAKKKKSDMGNRQKANEVNFVV